MNLSDFEMVARLLKERSGLILGRDKAYLLEGRLNPVARRYNFKGFDELAQAVRLARDEKLLSDVTEAMTTNESFFFRDRKPFDQFRDTVLPHFMESRAETKSLRIWSAACSNGQEPYSLAMILKENRAHLRGWHIEIVATDISETMLENARQGRYSQFEAQRGLPIDLLVRYFKQDNERWQIDDAIRNMVDFRHFNLLGRPSDLGRFDVVFCRNVLIYFDQATKASVLNNIAELMPDDGFLYLGGVETVLGVSDRFQPIQGQRGVYGLAQDSDSFMVKAAG